MTGNKSPSPLEPPGGPVPGARATVVPTATAGSAGGGVGSLHSHPSVGSRLGRLRAPSWVVEVSIFLLLAVLYTLVRASFVGSEGTAVAHARQIIASEGRVVHSVEEAMNSWLVRQPAVAVAACYFYALMHYAATPVVLIMSRRRGGRQYWRGYSALVVASGIAVLVYALYPLAPPRLVPDLGIVDVMRAFARYGWWGDAASAPRGIGDATNQYAAMPSMHCGWALWCAIQMWGFGTVAWRRLAVVYPTLVVVVVIATGNHFVLDVVGGAACVLVGYAAVVAVGRRLETRAARPTAQPAH